MTLLHQTTKEVLYECNVFQGWNKTKIQYIQYYTFYVKYQNKLNYVIKSQDSGYPVVRERGR